MMNQADGEPDLEALREEIRSGQRLYIRYMWAHHLIGIPLVAIYFLYLRHVSRWWGAGLMLVMLGGAAVMDMRLWLRRKRLRRALSRLSPELRVRTLHALDSERSYATMRIVEPLVKEFSTGKEIAPAVSPGGRGDEVSPK